MDFMNHVCNPQNETRTRTALLPKDFKSLVSTIPPSGDVIILHISGDYCKVSIMPSEALIPEAQAPVIPRLVPAPSPAKKTPGATWKC